MEIFKGKHAQKRLKLVLEFVKDDFGPFNAEQLWSVCGRKNTEFSNVLWSAFTKVTSYQPGGRPSAVLGNYDQYVITQEKIDELKSYVKN